MLGMRFEMKKEVKETKNSLPVNNERDERERFQDKIEAFMKCRSEAEWERIKHRYL